MAHRTQKDLALQWARSIVAAQPDRAAKQPKSTSAKATTLKVLAGAPRPNTRAECLQGQRPCPYVGCAHHLYIDVSRKGAIEERAHGLEPWEMVDTCALDVAERGWEPGGGRGPGATLDDVAEILGLTKERVRQIEEKAIERLKKKGRDGSVIAELFDGMRGEVHRGPTQGDEEDEDDDE